MWTLPLTTAWLLGDEASNLSQHDKAHLLLAQATAVQDQQQWQLAAAAAATLKPYACVGSKQPSALGLTAPAP